MNHDGLVIKQKNTVVISVDTKDLIQASVSENTLQAYHRALLELDNWISNAENNF